MFLQGALEEEVYMTLPSGHKKEKYPNLVCRLMNSMHELKQSSSVWYEKLSSSLISCGLMISKVDHFYFINLIIILLL
jgi:Reverse transcriptase (RNA-dependent DNA polymerase)